MIFLFASILKKRMKSLALQGGKKFLSALKKFQLDSRIISEIDNRADKELFFLVANHREYKYIESVKEDNIYDSFVDLCLNQQSYGVNINQFVDQHYSRKSKKAKEYICSFFEELRKIIFEVISQYASPEAKLILSGQEFYTDKILEKLDEIKLELRKKENNPTTVIIYCANMQNTNWSIGDYKPALSERHIEREINLSIVNSIQQPKHGDSFWEMERSALIANFEKKVLPLLDENKCFSVFGLAPIPLLILLGNQFAGRSNVDIYQIQKNPSSWKWQKTYHRLNIKTVWHNKVTDSNEAILIFSVSGIVNLKNISSVLAISQYSVVELSIEQPYDDCLRSKKQLDECMEEFRKAKEVLNSMGVQKIHLFAAIPPALAISIGQAYNRNYDAALITYDFNRGVYSKAFTVGEIL